MGNSVWAILNTNAAWDFTLLFLIHNLSKWLQETTGTGGFSTFSLDLK
jgi:hypothetical protein